jgi:spore germination protein YaaH
MLISARRVAAGLLTLTLLTVGDPVVAAEPSPAPDVPDAVAPESPMSPVTIHAEAAESLAGTTTAFEVGARPAPLAGAALRGGGTTATNADEGSGSTLALPNGLSREVFGYLPWWELSGSRLASMDYDLVSTIAFFGVPARSDGTLQKSGDGWNGWTSSHMTDVINAAHAERVKVVLTVTMMAWNYDYTAMTALLTNSTRRTKLANEIAATVEARSADGVNLDFEPMPNSLESAYTAFVRDVRTALGPDAYLTVATTGGAASWDEGYDLAGIVAPGGADAIMVMAYDFNWSGSARAGGVAPFESPYTLAVAPAMSAYLAEVPASRLIWGVPYYGRAWTTSATSQNSRTCANTGTCTAASWAFRYDAAVEALKTRARRWDATGRVPWYLYDSATYDTYVQSYYEDAQSLGIKYDEVEARGMRGVGIWHLLMDGTRRELWNELARNFKVLPYSDIEDSTHWQDIVWLSEQEITYGCADGLFCPKGSVRRDAMAGFLSRALSLPGTSTNYFSDDDGMTLEVSINRIAAASITLGCDTARYCPTRSLTRAEMASYLVRALGLPPATKDHFTDDDGTTHEAAINRLAEAGIASGCAANRFCPTQVVTREQMAAFLHRALGD